MVKNILIGVGMIGLAVFLFMMGFRIEAVGEAIGG